MLEQKVFFLEDLFKLITTDYGNNIPYRWPGNRHTDQLASLQVNWPCSMALKSELQSVKQEHATTSQRVASQIANNEALQERLTTQKQDMEVLNQKNA